MMRAPEEIRALYRHGRLIPFIGAGISMSVSWKGPDGATLRGPSWSEIVEEAAHLMGFQIPALLRARGTDLQILEYLKLKHEGTAPLMNRVYARLQAPDSALATSRIHEALAKLSKCRVFYTTNYDDFLERSLGLHGRPAHVVAREADMGEERNAVEVVKFHGDFNHPASMVITESDYDERLKFCTPMDFRLRSDMLGRAILFLGYSFRDANVAYLFRRVNEELRGMPGSASGRRAYIAVPDPSDFELRLFRARNIEVISIREATKESDVAELLEDLRS